MLCGNGLERGKIDNWESKEEVHVVICATDDRDLSQSQEAESAGPAPGHELDMNGKGLDIQPFPLTRDAPSRRVAGDAIVGSQLTCGDDTCFLGPPQVTPHLQ